MSETLIIKSKFRDYEVIFIDDFVKTIHKNHDENSFFIVDQGLHEILKNKIKQILSKYPCITVESSEYTKTLDHCQVIIKDLIRKKIRKNWNLVAIGGGIIQDITAFISSILFRGIDWIFYPTTLLAQADSCIGSKTSINLGEFKNLLGNFYPPTHIYIDINFLDSLPIAEIKSGIGEILHFFFIENSEFTEDMMNKYEILLRSPELLKEYIVASLKIKKKTVEKDEFDKNERNLFNYGHTFGHAIETVSRYEVNHGQAVTLGMDIANYISMKLGYLENVTFHWMHEILKKNMPSFVLRDEQVSDYLSALARDKKNISNNLTCILSDGPGSMRKMQMPIDETLKMMILSYFQEQ